MSCVTPPCVSCIRLLPVCHVSLCCGAFTPKLLALIVYDVMFRDQHRPSSVTTSCWLVMVVALALNGDEVEGGEDLAGCVLEGALDLVAGGHGAHARRRSGQNEIALL